MEIRLSKVGRKARRQQGFRLQGVVRIDRVNSRAQPTVASPVAALRTLAEAKFVFSNRYGNQNPLIVMVGRFVQ